MNPGRLFWKFFFAFWLALLLAGSGVGTAVWWHKQSEHERLEREREAMVAVAAGPRATLAVSAAAAVLVHGGEPALRELLVDWSPDRDLPLFVVDEGGHELFGRTVNAETLAAARAHAASDSPRRAARQVSAPDGKSLLLFIPAESADGHLAPGAFVGPPAGAHRPSYGHHPAQEPGPWLPVLAGLIASTAFSALLAWHLSKPIRNLRWALGAVAEGRFDTRVKALMGARRDEIADLGEDFDRMAQQIQSLIGAQRRLLHDVSHELRSPLARLQAAIGLLRQDPARLEASLDRIEREAVRVDELVGQLLTIARLDADTGAAREDRVELVELAAAIADDARFEAQTLGRDLVFVGQGEAEAAVRVELIQRAFENVIRNGVKYTAQGTRVTVSAATLDGRFVLRVADHGPGVPEADLAAIFEPFYRGANGHGIRGFGLGLAIARRAMLAHGGRIQATNREGGGLLVELSLPLTD
jgi:two-component system OmpR family sensor kinase